MARDPRSDEESGLSKYLPLLLLLLAGYLLYQGLQDADGEIRLSSISRKDPRVQERVNRHLEKTVEVMEMRKTRAIIEGTRSAMEYGTTKPVEAVQVRPEGVDLRRDSRAEIVVEDLGRETRVHDLPRNPTDMIHSQLFAEDAQKAEDAAYRKEYARQFIQNAKNAGWDVQLDENYRVISVKKAGQEAKGKAFQLFEDGSAGGF